MLVFGVLAFFRIKNEIAYGTHKAPWKFLSSAGAWSYLLYLIHGPAAFIFGKLHLPECRQHSQLVRAVWIHPGCLLSVFCFTRTPVTPDGQVNITCEEFES
jgi:peptidoglycan/LPS O-acetylase OafA/YrhL